MKFNIPLNHDSAPIIQHFEAIRRYALSIVSIFFLIYLSTFIFLAVIRVVTGISIKRIGFMSLLHISYSPSSLVSISIRSIKLSLHRPTFSCPGWLTLKINELDVAIDEQILQSKKKGTDETSSSQDDGLSTILNLVGQDEDGPVWSIVPPKSKLSKIIKLVFKNIKFFELNFLNTTLNLKDQISMNLGGITFKIDLRKTANATDLNRFVGTLDRYKFKAGEAPVSFKVKLSDVVLIPMGDNATSSMTTEQYLSQTELLDFLFFEARGIIDITTLSLKDLAVTLKSGTLNLHLAKIREVIENIKRSRKHAKDSNGNNKEHTRSDNFDSKEEGSDSESLPDSEVFDSDSSFELEPENDSYSSENLSALAQFGTILVRIVKEVEIKFELINATHYVLHTDYETKEDNIELAATAKDITIDLRRLNPQSPTFRLFFSDEDTGHQAIFRCNSISAAFYRDKVQEEFLYIPMISSISRTNIFSKTIKMVKHTDTDRNNSLLRTTINISTPALNLDTHQIPHFINALSISSPEKKSKTQTNLAKFQNLWPRAVVKITIDEPAARLIINPPAQPATGHTNNTISTEFSGLVVLNCSKIYCDFISSHIIANNNRNYTFKLGLHTSAFEAFYQTNSGQRFNLLTTESFIAKIATVINPSPSVICTANLGSIEITALHDEVLEGLKSIAHRVAESRAKNRTKEKKKSHYKPFFLREFPTWLNHLYITISNISLSIASQRTFDSSKAHTDLIGIMFQLSSLAIDYRSKIQLQKNLTALHKHTESMVFADSENDNSMNDPKMFGMSNKNNPAMLNKDTDGRNLAITFEGVSARKYKNGIDYKSAAFLDIPRFSVAFKTLHDNYGQYCSTSFVLRNASMIWDINLQYIMARALLLFRLMSNSDCDVKSSSRPNPNITKEYNAISVNTGIIRFKALLPNDVRLMLETNGLTFSKRRNQYNSLSVPVFRIYTGHPNVPDSWTRLIVVQEFNMLFQDHLEKLARNSELHDDEQILVDTRSIRFNIASGLVVYKVLDTFVSSLKATLILMDSAKTGKLEEGRVKEKKKMPKIPRVRIRSKALFLGMEDDLFESQLALIFSVGVREQQLRMEKEEQFERKVNAIYKGKEHSNGPSNDTQTNQGAASNHPEKVSNSQMNTSSTKSNPESPTSVSPPVLEEGKTDGNNIDSPPISPHIPAKTCSFGLKKNKEPKHIHLSHHNTTGSMHSGVMQRINTSGLKHFHHSSQVFDHVTRQLRHRRRTHEAQYDIIDTSTPDEHCTVSIDVARNRLLENFSTSWIKAFKLAKQNQKQSVKDQIEHILGTEEIDSDTLSNERIIDYSPYPFLFFVLINNPDILIQSPKFDEAGMRDFLFDVGKGLPKDTRFSLLIPIHLKLNASSLRMQLRDYPLPLMHFPELHPSQQGSTSISIDFPFVLAEGYSSEKYNIRNVNIALIPEAEAHLTDGKMDQFIAKVKRTVASVKIYSDMTVHTHSHFPTRITYCQAYQPGMQATMQVFDTFSKPPIDPSDKLGFWDKIRAVFHSRITFHWKESDVHLLLKGSANPYNLLGESAGFVMVWRNNVVLAVNQNNDPKKLFEVHSDDYLMAVPDYSLQEREYLLRAITFQKGLISPTNFEESTTFQKVVMKFTGQVVWYCGLLFEREIEKGTNKGRTFNFKPHYDVILKKPEYIDDIKSYDAYTDFRSDYLHMSISVISPEARDWKDDKQPASSGYNSIHLTPKVFSHFRKWWALFDNATSLPIRAGVLFNWDRPVQKSKKFGRHLFTVKYQLLLSPLFITHSYLTSDYDTKTNSYSHNSSGLKARIDNFTLDLHQRRTPPDGDQAVAYKRWRMNLNVGEMDFVNTDVRVLNATFKEKSHQESLAKKYGFAPSPGSSISNGFSNTSSGTHFTGKIKISDNDFTWIDMDDFGELGETAPATIFPKIVIAPMMSTPRWSYFRQTDHDKRTYNNDFVPFGNEDSHNCLIGGIKPETSYRILISSRVKELTDQLETNEYSLDSLKEDLKNFPGVKETRDRIENVQHEISVIKKRLEKIKLLEHSGVELDSVEAISSKLAKAKKDYENVSKNSLPKIDENSIPTFSSDNLFKSESTSQSVQSPQQPHPSSLERTPTVEYVDSDTDMPKLDDQDSGFKTSQESDSGSEPVREYMNSDAESIAPSVGTINTLESLDTIADPKGESSYTNRFIVHNLQLKWDNEVRNSVYHYLSRVSERKSNAYYITRRAVKYLEDLVEKHTESLNNIQEDSSDGHANSFDSSSHSSFSDNLGSILRELKNNSDLQLDTTNLLDDLDNGHFTAFNAKLVDTEGPYMPDEKYLIRLTSPQIQLVSDANPTSTVLITSENIQLKIIDVVDTEQEAADHSRVIESRYGVLLQDAQFYVFNIEDVEIKNILYFSSNTYGSSNKQSPLWPPWLAVEACYDSEGLEDFMIIGKTSATLRYDKPNPLRVQKITDTKELQNSCSASVIRNEMHHQNRIAVDFPKVVATTNSKQFYSIFTVVMDLMIYSEPAKKEKSERLDKVLLATDFNDLKNAVKQVYELQRKIHKFEDIRLEFLTRMPELDESAVRDLAKVELEQENLAFELSVMVMAIKAGMQKGSKDDDSAQYFKWTIGAEQVIWHIIDENGKPFMDMGLADASFNRIESSDGFNANSIEVQMIQAFNLDEDALYPEMFSPYISSPSDVEAYKNNKLISVNWTMLDPIGGIPIMEKFEVDLMPLKLQLEHSTWTKIFDFIFPVDDNGNHEENLLFVAQTKKPTVPSIYSDSDSSNDDVSSLEESEEETTFKVDRNGKTSRLGETDSVNGSIFHKIHMNNPFHGSSPSIRSGKSNTSNTNSFFHRDKEPSVRNDLGPKKGLTSMSSSSNLSVLSSTKSNSTNNDKGSSLLSKIPGRKNSKKEDDLSVMVKRASSYMSIVHLKVAATTICVSYKGEGSRSLLDIHEFVLNLPEIKYSNKTWSNMDLVLRLKKDVTKILLNHTGSLIGNKFKKHNIKSKRGQGLHQITNYVSFMSVDDLINSEEKNKESSKSSTPALASTSNHYLDRRATLVPSVTPAASAFSEGTTAVGSDNCSSVEDTTEPSSSLQRLKTAATGDHLSKISQSNENNNESTFSLSRRPTITPSSHASVSSASTSSESPSTTSGAIGHIQSKLSSLRSGNDSSGDTDDDDHKSGRKRNILKRLLN